jgi:GNAT superfamily N-acetyltransferase
MSWYVPSRMELWTDFLANHPETLPVLESWFKSEWPEWYGPRGPGNAQQDLRAYSTRGSLPVGLVGFVGKKPVGLVVLKASSISARPDLAPWAAAGLVHPAYRRRGFGYKLLLSLESVAKEMGFENLYCATASAALLLERSGWAYVDQSEAHGQEVAVYRKSLLPAAAIVTV